MNTERKPTLSMPDFSICCTHSWKIFSSNRFFLLFQNSKAESDGKDTAILYCILFSMYTYKNIEEAKEEYQMNKEEIKTFIPHREPMLLIDEAEVLDENTARGSRKIRGDEFFLQGHFPGNPIVPGVILCEMMAQTCSVLLRSTMEQNPGSVPFFTGLDKVRFKHPVRPGDTVEITCRLLRHKNMFFFGKGKVMVGKNLCAKGEFSFALVSG